MNFSRFDRIRTTNRSVSHLEITHIVSLSEFDHAPTVASGNFRAVACGQARDSFEHAICHFTVSKEGSTPLRARASEALVDRMDSNFFEAAFAELADGEHVLPVSGIARVAFLPAVGAGVEKVGRRRFQI